jgi:hypothetical protein
MVGNVFEGQDDIAAVSDPVGNSPKIDGFQVGKSNKRFNKDQAIFFSEILRRRDFAPFDGQVERLKGLIKPGISVRTDAMRIGAVEVFVGRMQNAPEYK